MPQRRVVVLINGAAGSAAAERARRIAAELPDHEVRLVHRGASRRADLPRFLSSSLGRRDVVYSMDMAVVPVLAGALGSVRKSLIVDTGDSPHALLELLSASRLRVMAAALLEGTALRLADSLVVRSQTHAEMLRVRRTGPIHVVPDGVDLDIFKPSDSSNLREQLGLTHAFTVGISGYFSWSDSLGGGQGSELVEAIAARPDLPIHGVFIGQGPGLVRLRELATRLGVAHRIHMVGHLDYEVLPRYLNLCDVCLLTLSNHPAGWVRTSGKLPGYLATGRYIVASRVGTAARILPEEMLLDYSGAWDPDYPGRLATRLSELVGDADLRAKGLALRSLAAPFDYTVVARAAADVIRSAH